MNRGGEDPKWIELTHSGTSLLDVFKSGTFKSTSLGKTKRLSLITGGKLQSYCKKEGFNVIAGHIKTRIGIAMNDNGSGCNPDHDSFLGFGNEGTIWGSIPITAFSGNEFKWHSNHPIIKTYGYILVR